MRAILIALASLIAVPTAAGELSVGRMSLNPFGGGYQLGTSKLSNSSYTRTEAVRTGSEVGAQRRFSSSLRRASPAPDVAKALEKVIGRFAANPGVAASGLDADGFGRIFRALIQHESGFNRYAVSPKGAMGLGQIMPQTAAELGLTRPFDIYANLDASARYLVDQMATFQDPQLALAAYNAGPGAVRRHNGMPPFQETQAYVSAISSVLNR
ncbi:MAG: lytic transglycosylase domain-containing protein [Pseudomonadota bacterium]